MKNNISDLNNHLFEQMERLNDEDLNADQLLNEIERARAMSLIARQIIDNGRLAVEVLKQKKEMFVETDTDIPEFLEVKKCESTQKRKRIG